MTLRIYHVAIDLVRKLRPLIERIRKKNPRLADQMEDALTSVPLNLHEGAYSQGRNIRARYHNALGSAGEIRACLDVAVAMEYLEPVDPAILDQLDHVIATVFNLTR